MQQRLHSFFLCFFFLFFVAQSRAQAPSTALDYNGSTDFTTLPNNLVSGLTNEYTIEAWVYWRGAEAPSDFQRVFEFGNNVADPQVMTATWFFLTLNNNSGKPRFAISIDGLFNAQTVDATVAFPTNTWTHIAVTVNALNQCTIFIGGQPSGTGTTTLRPDDLGTITRSWLGRSAFEGLYPDRRLDGSLDEFRISNNVRYTGAFTPQTFEFSPDGNTVALYHFNEGSGQNSVDASPLNNAAAILGETIVTTPPEDADPDWITTSILPVNFLSFTAKKTGNEVQLRWSTANSGEAGNFIVERGASPSSLKEIGRIGFSANAGTRDYFFTDAQPLSGKNFYRIKALEAFASPKYSITVLTDMAGKGGFALFPTLVQSTLFVTLQAPANLRLHNAQGVLVHRERLQSSGSLQVPHLAKGAYFVVNEATGETLRFIKQ